MEKTKLNTGKKIALCMALSVACLGSALGVGLATATSASAKSLNTADNYYALSAQEKSLEVFHVSEVETDLPKLRDFTAINSTSDEEESIALNSAKVYFANSSKLAGDWSYAWDTGSYTYGSTDDFNQGGIEKEKFTFGGYDVYSFIAPLDAGITLSNYVKSSGTVSASLVYFDITSGVSKLFVLNGTNATTQDAEPTNVTEKGNTTANTTAITAVIKTSYEFNAMKDITDKYATNDFASGSTVTYDAPKINGYETDDEGVSGTMPASKVFTCIEYEAKEASSVVVIIKYVGLSLGCSLLGFGVGAGIGALIKGAKKSKSKKR